MIKDKFFSELFRREVHISEPEYREKVFAEALYRCYRLEKEQCSCMKCKENLKRLKNFLETQMNARANSVKADRK